MRSPLIRQMKRKTLRRYFVTALFELEAIAQLRAGGRGAARSPCLAKHAAASSRRDQRGTPSAAGHYREVILGRSKLVMARRATLRSISFSPDLGARRPPYEADAGEIPAYCWPQCPLAFASSPPPPAWCCCRFADHIFRADYFYLPRECENDDIRLWHIEELHVSWCWCGRTLLRS